MSTSKAILLIPQLIALPAAVGIGMGHTRDAALAAVIAFAAVTLALLPMQFRTDRSPATTFQFAWISSILHLATFLALGATIIFVWKPPLTFALWLLAMYWLTLVGLCIVLVSVIRQPAAGHDGGVTRGE